MCNCCRRIFRFYREKKKYSFPGEILIYFIDNPLGPENCISLIWSILCILCLCCKKAFFPFVAPWKSLYFTLNLLNNVCCLCGCFQWLYRIKKERSLEGRRTWTKQYCEHLFQCAANTTCLHNPSSNPN